MSGGEHTPGRIGIPNVVATSHERIYLVIDEGCPPEADFTDCDDVHWCQDKIHDNSIGYIREDVARNREAELLTENEALRKALEQRPAPVADMFWDHNDGERFGHVIEDIVADYGPGEIVKIDQAARLPSIVVRTVMDGEDMRYEVVNDAIASAEGGV